MSTLAETLEEPPSGPTAVLVTKASRLLLIVVLVAPIAVFPLGLVAKLYSHAHSPAPQVASSDISPN